MMGHHGYAPALPFQQNAFGALAADDNDNEVLIMEVVADQVAALTYQSQLTGSTATTTNQRNEQQLTAIKANQQATHGTLHQIIAQLNAVTFNMSDAGWGRFGGHGCGRDHSRGFGGGPPTYVPGRFPPPQGGGFPQSPPPHDSWWRFSSRWGISRRISKRPCLASWFYLPRWTWLGIPIFGSDSWDPHWKRNSNFVSESGYSSRFFF
jgi:hypothetical protein